MHIQPVNKDSQNFGAKIIIKNPLIEEHIANKNLDSSSIKNAAALLDRFEKFHANDVIEFDLLQDTKIGFNYIAKMAKNGIKIKSEKYYSHLDNSFYNFLEKLLDGKTETIKSFWSELSPEMLKNHSVFINK